VSTLLDIQLDDYWLTHYKFGKASEPKPKNLGGHTKRNIIVNAIVPLLFMYGIDRDSEPHKQRAISFLETLSAESNSIIDKWSTLGMSASSAMDTQALLELKKQNCEQQRCLACPIGHKVMSS